LRGNHKGKKKKRFLGKKWAPGVTCFTKGKKYSVGRNRGLESSTWKKEGGKKRASHKAEVEANRPFSEKVLEGQHDQNSGEKRVSKPSNPNKTKVRDSKKRDKKKSGKKKRSCSHDQVPQGLQGKKTNWDHG